MEYRFEPGMSFRPEVLEQLLKESGISFRTTQHSFVLTCPRCSGEDKLWIYRRKQEGRFVCWHCGRDFSGRPEYVLTEILQRPVEELQEQLYGGATKLRWDVSCVVVDQYEPAEPDESIYPDPPTIPPDPFAVPLTDPAAAAGVQYLASRGVPLEVALEYGVTYHPSERRVLFPVLVNGLLAGWQGRAIYDTSYLSNRMGRVVKGLKILTVPPQMPSHLLMFEQRLGGKHFVVSEGPFDGVKLHLCGANAAGMGKNLNAAKMERLVRLSGPTLERGYLALDPNATDDTRWAAEWLRERGVEPWGMTPPACRPDFGAGTLEEGLEAFRGAERLDRARRFVYVDWARGTQPTPLAVSDRRRRGLGG